MITFLKDYQQALRRLKPGTAVYVIKYGTDVHAVFLCREAASLYLSTGVLKDAEGSVTTLALQVNRRDALGPDIPTFLSDDDVPLYFLRQLEPLHKDWEESLPENLEGVLR